LSGDRERAARLAGEAEALIGQITYSSSRDGALAALVEAVVAFGERVEALTGLAGAVAAADQDRAVRLAAEVEALIGQITEPKYQPAALAYLAWTLFTSTKPATASGDPPGSSPWLLRVRHLVAATLVTGSWADVVVILAHIDPPAATALTDAVLARWERDAPAIRHHETPATRRQAASARPTPRSMREFVRRLHGRR
jgi:hypothetical protein